MNYAVNCDCGKSLVVCAGDAGSQKPCTCGALVSIPSLSVLRQSSQLDSGAKQASQKNSNPLLTFGIALFLVLIIGLLSPPLLIPLGFLMVITGRLWFAMQILAEMALSNAMMVFFIPFMPTMFLFERFDIAWQPFFFGIAGFVVMMIGTTVPQ